MRKGVFAAAAAFAASPQGRRMIQQAKTYVTSPEGKRKLAELRSRVAQRGGKQAPPARSIEPTSPPTPS